MADISKVQILDGTYNIKDANSRDRLDALENSLNSYNKPINMNKCIFIGDSYSVLSGQDTWVDILISKLGLTSSDYYRYGEGSTGFESYNAVTGHRFIDLLAQSVIDVPTSSLPDITHIIVCGGANDMQSGISIATLESRIQYFINYANTYYPNAKVYIGMIGFTTAPSSKIYLGRALQAYQNCINYGGVYLNGIQNVIHDYGYFNTTENDTVHPNQNGSNALGNGLYQALMHGVVNVYRDWVQVPDNSDYNGLYCSSNNDIYRLKLSSSHRFIRPSDSVTLSPSNPIELFDFVGGCVGGVYNRNNYHQYTLLIEDTSGNIYKCNGCLRTTSFFYQGSIRQQLLFVPFEIDTSATASGYKVIEDVYAYWITPTELEFNVYDC